jgi:hypothetical protein
MLGHIEQGLWTSSYLRLNDSRVVRYRSDGAVCVTHAPTVENHDFDLIILVEDCARATSTLVSLANMKYPRARLIVVFKSSDLRHEVLRVLHGLRLALPRYSVFVPTGELELNSMRMAGLQSVKAEYFGLIRGGDMVHPALLHRISAHLTERPSASVVVRRAQLNEHRWASPTSLPADRFAVYRTEAVVPFGGYRSTGVHPYDPEWRLLRKLPPDDLPELLFYRQYLPEDENAASKAAEFRGYVC